MDPEMINGLSEQIISALKAMGKAKNIEEKLKYSEMIKNLCDSLGVFLGLMTSMGQMNDDLDDDEFDDEFDDDDESNNENVIPF